MDELSSSESYSPELLPLPDDDEELPEPLELSSELLLSDPEPLEENDYSDSSFSSTLPSVVCFLSPGGILKFKYY